LGRTDDAISFDAAVERMSRRLQGADVDACVDAANDIRAILTASDASRAVDALERLASTANSDDGAYLYVLATELRIERGYWLGFARTLPSAQRACARMDPGEKRDMLEALLGLAQAQSLRDSRADGAATELYLRLRRGVDTSGTLPKPSSVSWP
jgi:hypothetical protein